MDDLTKRVISMINRYRLAQGWPEIHSMPAGCVKKSELCPIVRALRAVAVAEPDIIFKTEADAFLFTVSTRARLLSKHQVETPNLLAVWIAKFDNDQYPQYVLPVTLVHQMQLV